MPWPFNYRKASLKNALCKVEVYISYRKVNTTWMPFTQGDAVQDLVDIGLTYHVREDFKSLPWIFTISL